MPSFHLPSDELNRIIQYWAYYSNDPNFPIREAKRIELSPAEISSAKVLFDKLQCLNCHTVNRAPTVEEMEGGSKGLAPDFIHAAKRLRHEWIVALLKDPGKMIPETRMPGFWPNGQSPFPDILEGSSEKQIDTVAKYILWLGQNR
jgi:mono/diheme cytochrome c family protein